MGYIRGYDPETLREQVDQHECAERLLEIEGQRSLPALLERVWLLKVLGRLDEAMALSDESVRVARMAGTRMDVLRARVLHATVLQYRGAYSAADHELATCANEAEGQGWIRIAAFAYQHQGRNAFDAADFDRARESFKQALFLRREAGASDADLETVLVAIDTVERQRTDHLITA